MTGFHDRYLIPVCLFMLVWLGHYCAVTEYASMKWKQFVPASLFLVPLIIWSPGAVHDFIAMKGAVNQAQSYVRNTLAIEPCDFDGGFEFNGYHCYDRTYERKKGQSWWWVNRENADTHAGACSRVHDGSRIPIQEVRGRVRRGSCIDADQSGT